VTNVEQHTALLLVGCPTLRFCRSPVSRACRIRQRGQDHRTHASPRPLEPRATVADASCWPETPRRREAPPNSLGQLDGAARMDARGRRQAIRPRRLGLCMGRPSSPRTPWRRCSSCWGALPSPTSGAATAAPVGDRSSPGRRRRRGPAPGGGPGTQACAHLGFHGGARNGAALGEEGDGVW
jgi:hypothetical protein